MEAFLTIFIILGAVVALGLLLFLWLFNPKSEELTKVYLEFFFKALYTVVFCSTPLALFIYGVYKQNKILMLGGGILVFWLWWSSYFSYREDIGDVSPKHP